MTTRACSSPIMWLMAVISFIPRASCTAPVAAAASAPFWTSIFWFTALPTFARMENRTRKPRTAIVDTRETRPSSSAWNGCARAWRQASGPAVLPAGPEACRHARGVRTVRRSWVRWLLMGHRDR